MKIKLLVMIALITLFSNMVQAVTYTYTVSGALVTDGAEITGSFDFDDNSMNFSNVMMTLTGATILTSTSGHAFDGLYEEATLVLSNRIVFNRAGLSNPGNPAIGIRLVSALATLSGGNSAINLVGYGSCSLGCEGFSGGISSFPANGQLQGSLSVVPLPATFPLYGTGLLILAFIGYRRKTRN